MPIKEHEIKRYLSIAIILLLAFLAFTVIKPIALSIFGGLILAYVFYPVYKTVLSVLRERNTAALAVAIIIVLVIFIPLWFSLPIVIKQVSEVVLFLQNLNIAGFVKNIIPDAPEQVKIDTATSIVSLIGKLTASTLGALVDLLLNLPKVLLNTAVVFFVFFFAMRDSQRFRTFFAELSPFTKEKEKVFVKQFEDITYSTIYGHILIGIVQGIVAGIGFLLFGVPRALLLTVFATVAAVIPVVGPWLVWIPVAVYLFATGNTGTAIGFTMYSILIVSTIDNFLRPYIIARRVKAHSLIILLGMIGGTIVFGVLGLILGPLILQYTILFLEAYKNKALAEMFSSES